MEENFFERVYQIARQIPEGRVTSYGAIAKALGTARSARMVGWAMNASHNLDDVPAHRVVNQKGILTGKHHFEGTNLWEFSCGASSDAHAGGWPPNDVRPEHRFLRVKGGFLYGKVSYENGSPALTFQHRDADGEIVHEEVFIKE